MLGNDRLHPDHVRAACQVRQPKAVKPRRVPATASFQFQAGRQGVGIASCSGHRPSATTASRSQAMMPNIFQEVNTRQVIAIRQKTRGLKGKLTDGRPLKWYCREGLLDNTAPHMVSATNRTCGAKLTTQFFVIQELR